MKNLRRVLSVLMIVAMLASMVVLASCGLTKSKVEKMSAKLADAKSYTMEATGDDYTSIMMVDFKNLVVYEKYDGKDYDTESYMWYDEDADKYYTATVIDGKYDEENMAKKEMEKEDFYADLADYLRGDFAADFARQVEWGLMEEKDGAFIDEGGEGDYAYKYTYKVEDGALVCEYERGETKNTSKVYDINKTKIEIPQEVIDAKAEKAEK